MKSFMETLRGARRLELFILMILLSVLGLALLNGAGHNDDSGKAPDEVRLEQLLEHIDGVGDVDVMISMDEDGRPIGAAVVAGGLDDIGVRLEIQSAIRALLDIDLNRIRIIGKRGTGG